MKLLKARKRKKSGGRASFSLVLGALFIAGSGVSVSDAMAQGDSGSSADLLKLSTPSFYLSVDKSSQTAVELSPIKEPGFNYTTGEWSEVRKGDGYYQLGDINFRVKPEGT
ncbi:DUF5695 domain-containing protein, partial [Marinilabilia sp.]|uniref:DUF5695 domain-containing protein n=1 Tax=Marinilabilia sp. TaxID=2021252 RepID=UPI0025BA7D50